MATLAIKPAVSPSLLVSPQRRNADQYYNLCHIPPSPTKLATAVCLTGIISEKFLKDYGCGLSLILLSTYICGHSYLLGGLKVILGQITGRCIKYREAIWGPLTATTCEPAHPSFHLLHCL